MTLEQALWLGSRRYDSSLTGSPLFPEAVEVLAKALQERIPHHVVCNYPTGPFDGPGCVCEVVPKGEVERAEARGFAKGVAEVAAANERALRYLPLDGGAWKATPATIEAALTEWRVELQRVLDDLKHRSLNTGYRTALNSVVHRLPAILFEIEQFDKADWHSANCQAQTTGQRDTPNCFACDLEEMLHKAAAEGDRLRSPADVAAVILKHAESL
jgi:hypothetical protein